MPFVTFKKNRLLREDLRLEAESGTTLLELAHEVGVPVGSNCGGVCGCSTCHVYVTAGFGSLEEMSDREADRLDLGFDVKLNSRLACQAEIGASDLVIDISEESLSAYLDENPDLRRRFEASGVFELVPHHHH
jgi:2Fe-2S ferredoxin